MFVIVASSVALALEGRAERLADPDLWRAIDAVFAALFGIEVLIKMTALGVIRANPFSFFRSGWNTFDFVIAVMAIVDVLIDSRRLGREAELTGADSIIYLRVLRLGRTARPLKLLEFIPETRKILHSLADSIVQIFSAVIVLFVTLAAFSIVGVALLSGRMGDCTDDSISRDSECFGAFVPGVNASDPAVDTGNLQRELRLWQVPSSNLDTFSLALSTTAEAITLEGYVEVMIRAIDAQGIDEGAKVRAAPENAFFFFLLIILVAFLSVQLFVAIVTDALGASDAEQTILMEIAQRAKKSAQKHARVVFSYRRELRRTIRQVSLWMSRRDPDTDSQGAPRVSSASRRKALPVSYENMILSAQRQYFNSKLQWLRVVREAASLASESAALASEDLRKAFQSAQKMIRIKCSATQLAVMDRYYSMRQDLIATVRSRRRGTEQLRKWSFTMMRWLEEVVNALLVVRKSDLDPPRPRFRMDLGSHQQIPAENLREWFEGLLDVVLNMAQERKEHRSHA